MTSLNERAWSAMERASACADSLQINTHLLPGGTRILDLGVSAPGGLEAGLEMARIGMSGLGIPGLEMASVGDIFWPWVTVRSDHPLESCFISQAAHWQVEMGDFHAMGSGPACLLNRELEVGKGFEYRENSDCAVLILEAAALPEEQTCQLVAKICGVTSSRLALLVAPTNSLAGSVQIAARSLETGLHKLHQLGFDLKNVKSGMGRCPLAAPAGSDIESLGRTNDMVMFGSQVWLSIKGMKDVDLGDFTRSLPAATSSSYGEPFLQTLKKAGGFYGIDPGLFAPAEITLVNLDSGSVFHSGAVDLPRLTKAIGI